MASLPTTESSPTPTFTTSRTAARPRVIPLFATSVIRRRRRPLSLHHNLPPKPYIRHRPTPVNTSSSSGTSTEEPGSPLTPIEDTFSTFVDSNNPPDARPIFIPKPNNPNINNIGWASASLKAYRTQAREAVESAVAFFRAYEDHWAAKLLLKDQLKSVKDTRTKAEARKGKKQKEKEQEKVLMEKSVIKARKSQIKKSDPTQLAKSSPAAGCFHTPFVMPRTRKSIPDASVSFQVRGFHISTNNTTTRIKVSTDSTRPPRHHDVIRVPLVESRFVGWDDTQAHIHDIDVMYRRCRYRVFFQRHQYLPTNGFLGIQGDLIVMRVGSKNTENVVNARKGDSGRIRTLAQR
ncbi:hypothetical protein FB446DRAFT_833096 [Lentinula raphanica]|nr:hypothetical protein FB446DRAFT_833096 [Lentinula raphanica]